MKMAGIIHPKGLIDVCGCKSVRTWISPNLVLSVLSLTESLRNTWLAVIAIVADVKQVITFWVQKLDKCIHPGI